MASSTAPSERTNFKITCTDGPTRRLSFPSRPTWQELSAKVAQVYQLPLNDVALAYTDLEGDDVTLNSDEELHLVYADLTPGVLVKFDVRTLPESSGLSTSLAVEHRNELGYESEAPAGEDRGRGASHRFCIRFEFVSNNFCVVQSSTPAHRHLHRAGFRLEP
jgi:hypothetical protein